MEQYMKALSVKADSGQEVVSFTDIPIPLPESGQVIIKVHVTPIHYSDMEIVKGKVQNSVNSKIPGIEGSGVIVHESKSIFAKKHKGKRVSFMQLNTSLSGSWGEYVVCDDKYFFTLDERIDLLRGSTLMINPLTILMMNEKIEKNKHKAIIHYNAGTDIGIIFIKWCHYNQLTCINVLENEEQYRKFMLVSPEHVLVVERPSFDIELQEICQKIKPTCFFDSSGGSLAGKIFNLLEDNSEMFLYGHNQTEIEGINPSGFIFSQKTIQGLRFKDWFDELSAIKRYKYYKKINKVSFVFTSTPSNVYPISQYQDAISQYTELGTTLLHFACNLHKNIKQISEDLLPNYISETLQANINSLPAYTWDGPDYPLKVLQEGIFKGELVDGKANGKGILLYNNTYYVGDFVNGKKHGVGRLIAEDYWYEGYWENDLYCGYGKYTKFSGCSLEGEFKFGKITGEGIERLSTGEIYTGSFVDSIRHGPGEIRFNDLVFTGLFQHGEPEGRAEIVFGDGRKFNGIYSKGIGIGQMINTDGTTVQGTMTGSDFTPLDANKL
jgi:NADPH:quinone reductase-like Zn-dependent oxidoreductase